MSTRSTWGQPGPSWCAFGPARPLPAGSPPPRPCVRQALKQSCEDTAHRVQTLSASSGRLDDAAMVLLTFAEFWEARKSEE